MPQEAIQSPSSPPLGASSPGIKQNFAIRPDLLEVQDAFWASLSQSGDFLTAEQRIAVARLSRGQEVAKGSLPPALEEAVTLMVTRAWELEEEDYKRIVAPSAGVSPGMFVEMVAVAAMVTQVDTFSLALGLEQRPLP